MISRKCVPRPTHISRKLINFVKRHPIFSDDTIRFSKVSQIGDNKLVCWEQMRTQEHSLKPLLPKLPLLDQSLLLLLLRPLLLELKLKLLLVLPKKLELKPKLLLVLLNKPPLLLKPL